jgi:hypothetical protein
VRLRVGVDAVEADALVRWPRAASVGQASRPVQRAPCSPPDVTAYAQTIDETLRELSSVASVKGARLEAELANALLHLDVVEGDFGAHTDRQLQGIASACVSEMLDDDHSERVVRWHLQRDERHLLIVAIAQDWIDLLHAAGRSAGLRLGNVEPEFISRWNESRHALKPGNAVFAVSAGADLAIAAVQDGTIAAISVGAGIELPEAPGAALLDDRVDRFLSGRGQDPQSQSAFVLASSRTPTFATSTRWTVVGQPEKRA